jgi:hypothetical protein
VNAARQSRHRAGARASARFRVRGDTGVERFCAARLVRIDAPLFELGNILSDTPVNIIGAI